VERKHSFRELSQKQCPEQLPALLDLIREINETA